jgi:hypothetical protein
VKLHRGAIPEIGLRGAEIIPCFLSGLLGDCSRQSDRHRWQAGSHSVSECSQDWQSHRATVGVMFLRYHAAQNLAE